MSKVRDLKAKIAELYEVPAEGQRLALTAGAADPALEDDAAVEPLAGKRIYMNPIPFEEMLGVAAGQAAAAGEAMAGALMGQLQEAAETDQALLESLQGVTYRVHFERPQDAAGQAAGKRVLVELDALASMEVVKQMVEVEMFGAVGAEPAFLVFQGTPVPPQLTLFHCGVEEGSTVQVVKEPPPTGESQLLAILAAATGQDTAALAAVAAAGGAQRVAAVH